MREMAMASTSTAVAVSDSEVPHLGSIEDLKLKVGPVRRNLFGPVDHHQLQQDFQRLLCMNVEVANKRWNFDFQSNRPGQGSTMEWEELKCQDVPRFYRSCTVRRMVGSGVGPKAPRRMLPSSEESSPDSSSASSSGDEYLEVTTRRCYVLHRPNKRKQANITDFFKVKRRRLLNYKGSTRL